jgi:tetratricopeptide (TPR) repeat protein
MRGLFAILFACAVFVLAANPTLARQDDDRLDGLFARLQQTTDAREATILEGMIWALWFQTGKDETDMILEAGNSAMSVRDFDAALFRFNHVIEIDPDFAEGWNRRATLYYLMGRFEASIEDINRTLALEPRHFGALSGLGLVNINLGRFEEALKAFERALEVNPHIAGAKENISALKKQLGEDI